MKKIKLIDKGFGTKIKKGLVLTGNLNWDNGATYKGALKSQKQQIPHGYGIYFFPESEQWLSLGDKKKTKLHKVKSYVGKFKDGHFHGKGNFKSVGDYEYKGDFKKGKFYGKGRIEYSGDRRGEIFEGIFKNDLKIKGKYIFLNGNIYEGELKNDEPNGKGKGIYKESGKTYIGQFKDSMFHGKGKWWTKKGEVCEGQFKDGARHGNGKQYFTKGKVAGSIYIGSWKDNKKSGKGKMKYYDGAIYTGEWKNDDYHGRGTLIETDGKIFKGIWKNSNLI